MRFMSTSSHYETLVDGREVEPYGHFELTKEQYEVDEQWRRLSDGVFNGLSPAAEKLVEEAKADPHRFGTDPTIEIKSMIEADAAAMRAELEADNKKEGDPT